MTFDSLLVIILTHRQVSSQYDLVHDCELFFFILAALGVQNYPVIVDDLFIDILLKKRGKQERDR